MKELLMNTANRHGILDFYLGVQAKDLHFNLKMNS